MHPNGIISMVITGLVIGALGRLAAPGRQAIGCLMTFLAGLVGAAAGLYIGYRVGLRFWPTVGLQVGVAAVLVSVLARVRR